MWTLVRLRDAHFPVHKLVQIYTMNVRSILEFTILVILNSLTKSQMYKLESIQKKATMIILNDYTSPYPERLKKCKLPSLEERWKQLFVKFAQDVVKSKRVQHWIKPNESSHEMLLRRKNIFQVPKCRTERYKKVP